MAQLAVDQGAAGPRTGRALGNETSRGTPSPLSRREAFDLARPDVPLGSLLEAAGAVRDAAWGRRLTYSRKVFLPVTNLCRDRCRYCTFRRDPQEPGAWSMTPAEISRLCAEGAAAGCKEALLCLGDRPEAAFPSYRTWLRAQGARSTPAYLQRACEIALEAGLLPHTNAGVLTRAEMQKLKDVNASLGLMLESMAPRLAGPGGAHENCPDKAPQRRLKMIREAGELAIALTTGILVGIGESPRERVEALLAIRELHRAHGHIQEVIVQPMRPKPGLEFPEGREPSATELARVIALARLVLDPEVSVQTPPNLSPADIPLLIAAGVNDWGGISPVTRDYVNPEAPWPQVAALAAACRERGYELEERLAIYPAFIAKSSFVSPRLRPRIETLQAALERPE